MKLAVSDLCGLLAGAAALYTCYAMATRDRRVLPRRRSNSFAEQQILVEIREITRRLKGLTSAVQDLNNEVQNSLVEARQRRSVRSVQQVPDAAPRIRGGRPDKKVRFGAHAPPVTSEEENAFANLPYEPTEQEVYDITAEAVGSGRFPPRKLQ
jgi:hypothetical protein